jgi:hypothetical protein
MTFLLPQRKSGEDSARYITNQWTFPMFFGKIQRLKSAAQRAGTNEEGMPE